MNTFLGISRYFNQEHHCVLALLALPAAQSQVHDHVVLQAPPVFSLSSEDSDSLFRSQEGAGSLEQPRRCCFQTLAKVWQPGDPPACWDKVTPDKNRPSLGLHIPQGSGLCLHCHSATLPPALSAPRGTRANPCLFFPWSMVTLGITKFMSCPWISLATPLNVSDAAGLYPNSLQHPPCSPCSIPAMTFEGTKPLLPHLAPLPTPSSLPRCQLPELVEEQGCKVSSKICIQVPVSQGHFLENAQASGARTFL